MQIKSCLGFVKPNSTQHFTFSTAQDLSIRALEPLLFHRALQKRDIWACVITYIAALIHPFFTCILTLLKKKKKKILSAERTTNSRMMQGEECPATFVCSRHSFIPAISGTGHMQMCHLLLPSPSDALLCFFLSLVSRSCNFQLCNPSHFVNMWI